MTLPDGLTGYALPKQRQVVDRTLPLPLIKVVGITVLLAFVIYLPNLWDPMIRHDDYPALFGDAHIFWPKTLHEGRWINYIWHLRGISTPAWLNFALYQMLWAVLSASIAVAAMGREGRPFLTILLASFILVATPATLIATWFNTLTLGLGITALYAVLGCRISQRSHRALLPVFVIVTFWAYTVYPLILLAVCLVLTQDRSLRDLIGLIALFATSFVAAVIMTYTLNWMVHGEFGVPLASWRYATPATSVAGLVANVPLLSSTFEKFITVTSYKYDTLIYFHFAMLVFSTGVLIRHAPIEALYLHAGLWVGITLIVLQVLKLGVFIPPRAFLFAWVFYAVIVSRAMVVLSRNPGSGGRVMRNLSLLLVVGYSLLTFHHTTIYRPWMTETRALGASLGQVDPKIRRPVFVYGNVMALDSAKMAGIQSGDALTSRVRQLTGHEVVLCFTAPGDCENIRSSRQFAGLVPPMRFEVQRHDDKVRLGMVSD
ncbi:hypothetical protein [Loktanella sp. SALINAS62]|uniref:hypothetical protein n=1 Tax=Loktanella sp. SALINAS62 TaxID=2706124 RepID=UPI001B8C84AA|nr:hypothetical protein [Loktanella sp. SALINAS62]MBS1302063.1 hypothetical protein [Loktanella sp. SALINAS62]